MKFAESCVIEQHIDSLLKGVEPTNLGLGTPDAAALIVRIVRGWVNDMAVAPKEGQDWRRSINVLGSGEECLPSARCDLRGTM